MLEILAIILLLVISLATAVSLVGTVFTLYPELLIFGQIAKCDWFLSELTYNTPLCYMYLSAK